MEDYCSPIIHDIKDGQLIKKTVQVHGKRNRTHYYIIAATQHEIPTGRLEKTEINVG